MNLLTTKEAAALAGVDESRIRQLIIERKIQAVKFGKSHAILRDSLERWNIDAKSTKRGRRRKSEIISDFPAKDKNIA